MPCSRGRPAGRHRACAVRAALLLAVVVVAEVAPAAADRVHYAPPVDGQVVDPYRPPDSPYGAGNRGVDLAAEPGTPVRAAADGQVVFAGLVGATRHVVVLHADGIRTSYSFLADVAVARGQPVAQGDVVGLAAGPVHFGARAGDTYLDPMLLLGGGPVEVHLVPHDARRPASEAEERRGLLDQLGDRAWSLARGGARVTGEALAWLGDTAQGVTHEAVVRVLAADLPPHVRAVLRDYLDTFSIDGLLRIPVESLEWWRDQEGCTPPDVAPPPVQGRRIAVLVGGFGSAGGDAAVLDVDAASLGYAADDVVQFSYAGGVVPGIGHLAGAERRDYGWQDTDDDVRAAGDRLHDLLADIGAAHPGVPVDVIAHSQGGLVTRWALGRAADPAAPPMPEIGHVVTLGSPHQGADAASAATVLAETDLGPAARVAGRLIHMDPESTAAQQMAEGSEFLAELGRRPPPPDIPITSIAARSDWAVAAPRTLLDGATNVLLPVDGPTAHDALPGSAAARREVALVLAGLGPTCRSAAELALGAAVGAVIGLGTDATGAALAVWERRDALDPVPDPWTVPRRPR